MSQCTYRCVVLPDFTLKPTIELPFRRLNAPTGAWCSLTRAPANGCQPGASQCTYRCVVLPDVERLKKEARVKRSQCTYRCVVLPDQVRCASSAEARMSQCTYRCVVLPDERECPTVENTQVVSMHLQVRGAP